MNTTVEKPPVQKKTIKVPQRLYREAEFKVEGEGENQKIRMSISSDEPYLRYDWWNDEEYWEVLSHAPGDVDESRLKAGLPILFNHNRDDYLGRATTYLNDGHRITVEDIIWSQSDQAQQKKADAISGALPYTSVGYSIDDEEGEAIGVKDGKPIYKFKWTPFEGGPCTVPADISTGTNRTRDHKPEGEPKEISVKKIIDTERETTEKPITAEIETGKIMDPTEQAAADEKARKQREADEKREAQERAESVREGVKGVREREKEIRAIAKRATNLPDEVLEKALEDAITNENAVEAFRKLVFEKYFGTPQPIDTPAGQGTADIRVIGERGGKSLGQQFIESESFKRRIVMRGQGESTASISVDYPILGIRGKVAMAQRAGFTSTDLAAVNVQIQTGILGLGVQRLTIMDLIAPGNTAAAAIIYPRENSFGTVDGVSVAAGAMPRAKAVGERGLKPLWDPDLTTETATVHTIAVTTKVPKPFMADFPAARSFIDERLPFMVDTETEYQILYGDGLGNNLKGIFATTGVQTRAITTTDDSTKAASLLQGLTDIRVGSFFEPDGYAFHPYDWETAQLLKDSTGRFLAGGPFYIPYTNGVFMELRTFWGKPAVVSTAVNYGKPVAGCWKLGAQYFLLEGMQLDMTNANEDDFRRNLIMLRAEHRLALAVYRPVSFLEFTGFPARG